MRKHIRLLTGCTGHRPNIVRLAGGSFDPWGGPGYAACEVLTGPDFQDVFYKENWASNVKLISYYMLYGYACSHYI